MNDIIILLGSASIGYIFYNQITFLEVLKEKMGYGVIRKRKSKNKIIDFLHSSIHHFLNCICISFWITLIFTGNIFLSAISYITASFIVNYLNRI